MKNEGGSDAQVPFYIGYLWVWEKAFGHGEWTLRAANLPWILLGHAALLFSFRRAGTARGVAIFYFLAAALSPFLTFYLNQARCYAMQYATACMVFGYLLEVSANPARALDRLPLLTGASGALFLCGTSLLGVVWAGSAFLAAGWMIWKSPEVPRISPKAALLLGLLAIGLSVLGLYYLGTLFRGVRATGGVTSIGTVFYCLYEMIGFAGLGPARNDLRAGGIAVLKPYAWPLLLGGVAIGGTLASGIFSSIRRNPLPKSRRWVLGLLVILPLGFVLGTGVTAHFRVLGRHLMAVYPLLLFGIALAQYALWKTRWKVLPMLFLTVWAASSGMLRFAKMHHRDDYRSAAALAVGKLAAGKRVWWVADQRTGGYYGLGGVKGGTLTCWINAREDELNATPEPDCIVLSKGEIYDPNGAIGRYITGHHLAPEASFQAFKVFKKQ